MEPGGVVSLDQITQKTLGRVCCKWGQPVRRLRSLKLMHKLEREGDTSRYSASEPRWRMVPSSKVSELEN